MKGQCDLDVSIVVLSWNRKEDLRLVLTKIRDLPEVPKEVIVVDNASGDGSQQMVRDEFPFVSLIELRENIGIAGWNEGFKVAQGDYILVLDDDSYPEPDALRVAVRRIEKEKQCAIVAMRVSHGVWNETKTYQRDPDHCVTFMGCGALIRRSMFSAVGYYSNVLFLYMHEVEFSMRVLNRGYDIVYEPHAVCQHGRSSRNREKDFHDQHDARTLYYYTRNVILILLLHFPLKKVVLRVSRIIIGRFLFALWKLQLLPIAGICSGLRTLIMQWPNRVILDDDVQRRYGYGSVAGGFFGLHGFTRPSWLRDLPK